MRAGRRRPPSRSEPEGSRCHRRAAGPGHAGGLGDCRARWRAWAESGGGPPDVGAPYQPAADVWRTLIRLEERYKVIPIGVADAASLKRQHLLLMAHPRAQPAEALVELDQWVRDGGRVLLLADPRLDWPSERALGDKLRPPPGFADTGLLKHWGLDLEAPNLDSAASAGRLSGKKCGVSDDGLVAHCAVGRGQATVIADADFLNSDQDEQLELLVRELERLESR